MVCFHVHEFDVHDHVHDSYQHVFLAFILQKSGKRNDQNIQLWMKTQIVITDFVVINVDNRV